MSKKVRELCKAIKQKLATMGPEEYLEHGLEGFIHEKGFDANVVVARLMQQERNLPRLLYNYGFFVLKVRYTGNTPGVFPYVRFVPQAFLLDLIKHQLGRGRKIPTQKDAAITIGVNTNYETEKNKVVFENFEHSRWEIVIPKEVIVFILKKLDYLQYGTRYSMPPTPKQGICSGSVALFLLLAMLLLV